MATLRELKGRIGSVASSEKITGAMKMISSAKMHKAELALKRLVPYRSQIETIISNLLSADAPFSSPLTETRGDIRRIAIVVFGSDDGLCGAYNVNISKHLLAHIADLKAEFGDSLDIDIYAIGRKMQKIVGKINDPSVECIPVVEVSTKSEGNAVRDFIRGIEQRFTAGEVDRVEAVYMRFVSAGRQTITCKTLLPIDGSSFASGDAAHASSRPYIFEPDPATVFRAVLPLFLQSRTQEIFGQNRASEQAARIMAMQSANDNAKKLLEQLQLEYNKLRQQSITTELLDIVGGQIHD